MPTSTHPQPSNAFDAAARRLSPARRLTLYTAGAFAAVCAVACGPRSAPDSARGADNDRTEHQLTSALLPPGAYRIRARGVNTYLDTFPLPGVLRIDAKAAAYANATLELDVGPKGLRTGTYEGSVRARGDSAVVTLACHRCRIQTPYGESYADLTYAGEFGVRVLGGGRFALTAWRASGDRARWPADTLVRVDP